MKTTRIVFALLAVRLLAAAQQAPCLDSGASDFSAKAYVCCNTGLALGNDGTPFYIDGDQNAKVRIAEWGDLWAFNSSDKRATPIRFLKFDLGTPVPVVDYRGEFHVLYKVDPPNPATGLRQKHSIQEIPADGIPVEAGRVEMKLHINGVPHLMLFGTGWPRGVCVAGSTVITPVGTTAATITRFPGNQYDLTVPAPFYGRLYNNKNSDKPVDLGLRVFPFFVCLTVNP